MSERVDPTVRVHDADDGFVLEIPSMTLYEWRRQVIGGRGAVKYASLLGESLENYRRKLFKGS